MFRYSLAARAYANARARVQRGALRNGAAAAIALRPGAPRALSSCDWFRHRVYALFPHAIGSNCSIWLGGR
eukprot:3669677-Pyramimonas_sp.AAC.1